MPYGPIWKNTCQMLFGVGHMCTLAEKSAVDTLVVLLVIVELKIAWKGGEGAASIARFICVMFWVIYVSVILPCVIQTFNQSKHVQLVQIRFSSIQCH